MNSLQDYAPSGVDWIGSIPSHWETVQPKYRLNRVTRPIDEKDEVVTCFRDGVVTLRKNRREEGFTNSIKEHGYQQIQPGDLVVHEMDGFAGAIGISDSKGKSTPVYTVIEPDGRTDLKYVAYLLREMSRSGKIESLARSIRERTTDFRWNMWSVINFPFPPLAEQTLISSYLDKKTKRIDLLIDNIKQIKKLIKESIRAYFFEIRLKKVKLNHHPTEWFQCLPEDWEIVKFRQLFEPIKITNNSSSERLLSVTQDKGVVFRDEQDRAVVNPGDDISSYKLVEPGDVIISLRSADGGLEISDIRGLVSPAYIVLKPKLKIDRNFYRFLLTSENFIVEMNRYVKGIRDGKNIYFDDIKDVPIPCLPPSKWDHKQEKLIDIHQNLVNSFGLYDRKIQLLEEYRQRLISAVVTGRVRVTEDMI
jgi:type I restriction enzyme S subunit